MTSKDLVKLVLYQHRTKSLSGDLPTYRLWDSWMVNSSKHPSKTSAQVQLCPSRLC